VKGDSARKAARKAGAPRTSARKAAARTTPARKRPAARKAAVGKSSALGKAATAVRGTLAGAVAAVKRTVSSGPPDAIALLESDHRRMQKLLTEGEKTTPQASARRSELLDTLTAELKAHELLEERVLYPALEAHPESRDVTLEGFQEHHVADVIVEELHGVAADSEDWGAKFTVLKENIDHHIEEEEGGLFRTARGLFSQDELDAMGAKMAAMRAGRA
jgi:hemerythrin-like domain-containing protein